MALCPAKLTLHENARGPFPYYPARLPVPDEHVPWTTSWPDYMPTQFTAPHVLANDRTLLPGGWADPSDPSLIAASEWQTRCSYEGPVQFDGAKPINPRGRTGIGERGYLGKWGPNHAADPIVTRFEPTSGNLQVVAIVRRDTGVVALPGGMVDAGELVTDTVKREFTEEALNLGRRAAEEQEEVNGLLARLFTETNGVLVYKGYVDDPRNTDHAWMETAAYHFHAEGALALLQLEAGDDAAGSFWQTVSEADPKYASMKGKRWIDAACSKLRETFPEVAPTQAAVSSMLMGNMRRR